MLAIEPRGVLGADKELTAISVGSCVGHRKSSQPTVDQIEIFILKLVAIDALSASTIEIGEVAAF